MHQIRNAEFADMKRLGEIMAGSFRSAFCGFISEQTLDACAVAENCQALLEGIHREGAMHILVGDDCGMLVWRRDGDWAEIAAIHSLPESWGTGLGRELLTTALAQMGPVPVYLWAFRENARARRFYEKNGFRWDGMERVSEFDGAVEVRYVRENN